MSTPSPVTKIASTVTTFETEAGGITTTISSWHVNGWLLVGAIVVANLVGVLFHF